jgi:hypothetical protein
MTSLQVGQPRILVLIPGKDKRFSLSYIFQTDSGASIRPSVKWGPGAVSPGVKRQGHKADHSTLFSTKVENGGAVS